MSLDGEFTGIDAVGRDVEVLFGMKDGASGKLGLVLVIDLKLGSLLEIAVGIELGVSVDDGGDDGRNDGNSVND